MGSHFIPPPFTGEGDRVAVEGANGAIPPFVPRFAPDTSPASGGRMMTGRAYHSLMASFKTSPSRDSAMAETISSSQSGA